MSITPPDRSRSPSPQEDFQYQQALGNIPPQQPGPIVGDAEALVMQPLTLWDVLTFTEEIIETLSEEQIGDTARYINQHRMTLIHELHSHLGACSYELQDKLLALADNPYIKRDQTLMEFLVRTSDFVGRQAIHEGYKETRRQTQAVIERSERNKKAFEERQAREREEQIRHDAEQAIDDRAFQEEHRLQQESQRLLFEQIARRDSEAAARERAFQEEHRLQQESQRLLFEQIARRDSEAAARERARQEAAQRADDIPPHEPPHEHAPRQPHDLDDWTGFFKVSAIIACLAAVYVWLRRKSTPPKID